MIIIGVTGSIGMGKSTIAGMLKRLRISVFDSDQVVKDILENNNHAKKQICELWPDVALTRMDEKKIDKKLLSTKIFSDRRDRKILEGILHPIVQSKRNSFINNKSKSLIIALDVPLLYETGTDKICDEIFLVITNEKEQQKRVLSRKNMTFKKLNLIKKAQWSDQKKRNKEPYLVTTSYGKLISFIIILGYLIIIIFKRKVFKL